MDKMQLRAVLAGVFFGIYPLLLNRAKLGVNISSAAFCLVVFICVAPFAYGEVGQLRQTYWVMLLGAGVASAAGMLSMTGFLVKVPADSVAPLIVLMMVTQTVLTACYQIYMDGGVSVSRFLGFVLAAGAIVLLNRK